MNRQTIWLTAGLSHSESLLPTLCSEDVHIPLAPQLAPVNSMSHIDGADLRRVIAAWPTLREPLKVGIGAMIKAAQTRARGPF